MSEMKLSELKALIRLYNKKMSVDTIRKMDRATAINLIERKMKYRINHVLKQLEPTQPMARKPILKLRNVPKPTKRPPKTAEQKNLAKKVKFLRDNDKNIPLDQLQDVASKNAFQMDLSDWD